MAGLIQVTLVLQTEFSYIIEYKVILFLFYVIFDIIL